MVARSCCSSFMLRQLKIFFKESFTRQRFIDELGRLLDFHQLLELEGLEHCPFRIRFPEPGAWNKPKMFGSPCWKGTQCKVFSFWGLGSGLDCQVPCLDDTQGMFAKKQANDVLKIRATVVCGSVVENTPCTQSFTRLRVWIPPSAGLFLVVLLSFFILTLVSRVPLKSEIPFVRKVGAHPNKNEYLAVQPVVKQGEISP